MPLRFFQYFSQILEKEYITSNIYKRSRVMIPAPTFVIFYNGREEQPERKQFRLSDSFEGVRIKDKESGKEILKKPVNLELIAIQLNINPGYNDELKKGCPALMGYVEYWEKIRQKKEGGQSLEEAVKTAVDECIDEGILAEFFRKNKAEVEKMSIYEFDQKEYERVIREEAKEEQKKEDEKIIAEKDEVIAESKRRIEELEKLLASKQ